MQFAENLQMMKDLTDLLNANVSTFGDKGDFNLYKNMR